MRRLVLFFALAIALVACGGTGEDPMSIEVIQQMRRNTFGKRIEWPAPPLLIPGPFFSGAWDPPSRPRIAEILVDPACEIPPVWSIQLGIEWNQTMVVGPGGAVTTVYPAGTTQIGAHAKVKWGSLGGSHEADVDFVNGASFSVVGHTLTIDVFEDTLYGAVMATMPSPFAASASVALGTLASSSKPTRTLTPAAGGSFVQVPPYARTVSVIRTDASAALSGYTLAILSPNGEVLAKAVAGAGGEIQNFELPNGAFGVGLSAFGVGVTGFRFVFELDLGS